jgi:hypothetical protein
MSAKTKPTPSRLAENPAMYRAQLSCKVGRDVLDGKTKPPNGVTQMEYALFFLLHAVDEIAGELGRRGKV